MIVNEALIDSEIVVSHTRSREPVLKALTASGTLDAIYLIQCPGCRRNIPNQKPAPAVLDDLRN
jgi:hypothetical protein